MKGNNNQRPTRAAGRPCGPPQPRSTVQTDPMIKSVQVGTSSNITARRSATAHKAANAILADAQRGPAMGTNVEQHITGLGRQQLAQVVAVLFAELAAATHDVKQ
jgi:hypothetical protein